MRCVLRRDQDRPALTHSAPTDGDGARPRRGFRRIAAAATHMNVERGTAMNGRCYAHAAAWATINGAVLRGTYASGAIQPAQRIYYQHDANFNTTAIVGLVGSTWQVTQRYIYDPYGNVTVLNADWTNASTQIPLTQYLHQGGRLDPITGLYLFRHRDYSPTLGQLDRAVSGGVY